jgi:uncharacterized DUF497 family protein
MTELRFEWDEAKERENRRKHRVSFDEAESVFADEWALLIDDPEHSDEESRFILMGISAKLRVLVVVHAYREAAGIIRIVSARRADSRERERYNQRWSR